MNMKRSSLALCLAGALSSAPTIAHAAGNAEVQQFTSNTLGTLIGVASLVSVFFLIRGGYLYITSTGKPEALDEAKKTIRNALLGLAVVVGASLLYSLFNTAFTQPAASGGGTALNLVPISPVQQDGSLAKILMDAIAGFLQNLVQSATRPLTDAITGFLTGTPALSTNSVVFNFWLIIVGITDSLFALVIALLGFQVMSASTFGFEELTLKELLPRIGLSFLVANTSIFAIDWLILLCQTLVHAVLAATGGIGSAWILNAFSAESLANGSFMLITLIFMAAFVFLAAVLLLFYIARLMILAFGAVMSPIVCLLWLIPKTQDFAESLTKAYLVTLFSIFTHVIIIQLASAFLTVPNQQAGSDPLISVLIGIAMFGILLKSTALTVQLALASQTTGTLKKFGGQIMNVMSPAVGRAAGTASAASKAGRSA